ncbi:MAG: sulfotransferase family protein [Gemmataceae bacterium]
MQTSRNGRTFEKPYRTWGAAALNFLGRRLRSFGWKRPLTFQGVLDSACRFTRLSDWGEECFHEPLRILVQCLEEEAELTPLGRLFMKATLRHFAANRLLVRQYVKDHPEALEEPLPRPLFVVGLPRTGTTLLYNLLCRDETRRPLLMWEAMQPAPNSGKYDTRRNRARLLAHLIHRWSAPQLRSVHPLEADGPDESTALTMNTFVSPAFVLLGRIPRYIDWLLHRGREMLPWAYEQYRIYLQVLRHQGRRAPWILKSPGHSYGLQALLSVFPDACVVLTQRDLIQVVPSTCSLFAIMHAIYSDNVDCRRLGPEILELLRTLQHMLHHDADLNSARIFSVEYRALISDPIGAVRAIYQNFDLPLENGMEQRMRDWMARNPHNKHGVHQYDLEQFGLSPEVVQTLL